MALHALLDLELSVPDPDTLVGFWTGLGMTRTDDVTLGTADRPSQLRLAEGAYRHVSELRLGCSDQSDLVAIRDRLAALGVDAALGDGVLRCSDPLSDHDVAKSLENALAMFDVLVACGVAGTAEESQAAFDTAVATEEGRAAIAEAVEGQDEHFDMLGLQLGFTYPPSAGVVVDDGSAPVEVANPVRQYVPTTHPGGRLPHAWVIRDGRRLSSFDLVPHDRYALVTGSVRWAAAGASLAGGPVPLAVVWVGGDVLDPDGGWAAVSGIGSGGAVLVRPDQHVAWRSPGAADDPAAVPADLLATLGGAS